MSIIPKLAFDPQVVSTTLCMLLLRAKQDQLIFRNRFHGLEELLAPECYEPLKKFAIRDARLLTSDNVPIQIWEKEADPASESKDIHHVMFHGNNGHVADAGPQIEMLNNEGYDRHARISYLAGVAETGSGFTGVSLRGYGKSEGKPGEAGFKRDIKAIVDHLENTGKLDKKIVITGESLGSWAALEMAVEMTGRGKPPSAIKLINPFASMAQVVEDAVGKPEFLKNALLKNIPVIRNIHPHLAAERIDKKVLHHHFDNIALIPKLLPETTLFIVTSAKDEVVSPINSDMLEAIAKENIIKVMRRHFPDAGHTNIPVQELLNDLVDFFPPALPAIQSLETIIDKAKRPFAESVVKKAGEFWQGLHSKTDRLLKRNPGPHQNSQGL